MSLIAKTVRYLRQNGLSATAKKIVRRASGRDWLPQDEDALYEPVQFVAPEDEQRRPPEKPAVCSGLVSVVIPCYNGADELPALLEKLQQQTGIPSPELIVVDSGSVDGTAELAERYGAKVVRISQEMFAHDYARRLGAKHASGEYLLFMTQDALPDRTDWIHRLLQPILLDGAAAVSCIEQPRPDADLISRVNAWNWRRAMLGGTDRLVSQPADNGFESLRRCAMLSDNACLVRADAYWRLGGHQGHYAEDLDLGIRLLESGERLGLLGSVTVVHSHNRSPLYYFKRALVDALRLKDLFADYPLDTLTLRDAVSRIAVAACAGKWFAESLAEEPPCASPEALREWLRLRWNQYLIRLRTMDGAEIASLLRDAWPESAGDSESFVTMLWDLGSADYHFDPSLTVSTARYLMHTVCDYLSASNMPVDTALSAALAKLLWQYFAQSAGYAVAACFHAESDARLQTIRDAFCSGV